MTNLSGAYLSNGASFGPQFEGMDRPSTFPNYSQYNYSGVDWLGFLPSHWSKTKISRVSQSGMGQTILKEMLEDVPSLASLPVYSASEGDNVFGYFSNPSVRLKAGDLVVGARGSIGKVRLIVEESTCTQTTIWVKPITDLIFSEYLYWTFVGGRESLFPFDKTAIPMLTIDQLKQGWLALPSVFEQAQIAHFLDHETARIDALIEEQRRLIELLKEKRQAVIFNAVTKGLDPTVTMKDSGVEWLGVVPAHWVVCRAKLVSDIFVPQRNKPELNDDNEGLSWVTMEDMNGGYISSTNLNVSRLAAIEAGSKVLKKGAVIASCVGRFGVVAINSIDVVINQQLQAFEPKKIKAEYLRSIISLSKEYFEMIGTAATLVYVNQQGFENLPVICPSADEQDSICVYVDEISNQFNALLSKSFNSIQLLQERRTVLISAAVTGKIDVRGWKPPASAKVQELEKETK